MHSDDVNSKDRWRDAMAYLRDIKQGRSSLKLPVLDEHTHALGHIEPITSRHLPDANLIATFVRWRNNNRSGYLDQRPVDELSTARWLAEVVSSDSRVSFLIYFGDNLIGRCGAVNLSPAGHEADSLVRGERGGGFEFMLAAQRTGLAWLFSSEVGGMSVTARVLADNDLALHNCRELGYEMTPVQVESSRIQASSSNTPTSGEGAELWTITMSRQQFEQRLAKTSPSFKETPS